MVVFVLAPAAALPQVPDVGAAENAQSRNAQDNQLLQQMDHQRRLADKQESVAAASETGPITTAQESTASLDLAVIVIMGVSALAFLIVCRLKGGSTRECITPRRSRPRYPSRN